MVNSDRLSNFNRSDSGATMIEIAIIIQLLFVVVLGFVDFGFALFQWNLASKAVQMGARLAAVSDPVDSTLSSYTGLGGGNAPGDPIVPFATRTCDGATSLCSNGTFDLNNFRRILAGSDWPDCTSAPGTRLGMCDIFWRIDPENVVVSYEYSGLGYATRPGGPVPTIQIRLQNITFDFFFLDALLSFAQLTIPSMTSTITGEDLSRTWP